MSRIINRHQHRLEAVDSNFEFVVSDAMSVVTNSRIYVSLRTRDMMNGMTDMDLEIRNNTVKGVIEDPSPSTQDPFPENDNHTPLQEQITA